MLRTLKSVCQLLHFPSEVQFHISNCLLTLQKPQILLVQTEFTIFLSAPIPIPGSSIRFTYLMNDTTKSPTDQTKTPGVTLLIPFSSIIQSTPSICIPNHLSYGGGGWYRMSILMMSQCKGKEFNLLSLTCGIDRIE